MKEYGQFHDGYLDGLWIDDKTVHVFLHTLENERFTAVAVGVVALGATGFRSGNIILQAAIRQNDEIVSRDIADFYDLQDSPAGEGQGMRLLEKARQEGLTLLQIAPSYGATCLVLAHSVELLERSERLARYPMSAAN